MPKLNFLLITFVVTIVYCICKSYTYIQVDICIIIICLTIRYAVFPIHLVSIVDSFKYQSTIHRFLSKFLFNIILFHWYVVLMIICVVATNCYYDYRSLVGHNLFLRVSLLCFQRLIALDLRANIYLLVSYLITYADAENASLNSIYDYMKRCAIA
jgi:hypothetical protein